MSDRWIEVTVTLPEDPTPVLAVRKLMNGKHDIIVCFFTKGNDIEFYNSEEDLDYLSTGWYESEEQYHGEFDFHYMERNVTHWQPLPEPPTLTTPIQE